MKKILCLILCVVMMLGVLVSCEDDLIKEADDLMAENSDKKPVEDVKVELDFYIISGEGSIDYANKTVANKIRDEFETLYNTTVTMHFVTAEEYEKTLLDAHPAKGTEEGQADYTGKISIALVNNAELYDELYERDLLVDLNALYNAKAYSTLKKQLAKLLPLTEVKETETYLDDKGDEQTRTYTARYVVPNNHVFGTYKYIVVNKALAKAANEMDAAQNCHTEEDAAALLARFNDTHFNNETVKSVLEAYNADTTKADIEMSDVVQVLTGNYEDIAAKEADWYCNIIDVPTATYDDLYSSCFVVLGDQSLAERAMQILYKINTDTYFRNLLQYGVKDINYKEVVVDGKVVGINRISNENSTYNMYLKYTGDIFKAHFCLDDEDTAEIERVCIFCTDDACAKHIYWNEENYQNCVTHVDKASVPVKSEQ